MLNRVAQAMFHISNEEMINFNYRRGLLELNFYFGDEDRKIELKSLYVQNKKE